MKEISQNEVLDMLLFASENQATRTVTFPRNGKPLQITLRGLTEDELDRAKSRCTRKQRGKATEFDDSRYARLLVATANVAIAGREDTTFGCDAMKSAYKCSDGEQVVKRALRPGEIAAAVDTILDLSGFYEGVEEEDEDLKNSSQNED